MNLHEYQARVLLREGGIPVPEADVAVSPEEVAEIAGRVGGMAVLLSKLKYTRVGAARPAESNLPRTPRKLGRMQRRSWG